MIRRALLIAVVAAGLLAGLLLSQRRTGPLKVSGFIEADEIRVGSRVGGRVASVLVKEGSAVKKGETLVELEPYNLKELLSEAGSQLRERQANLKKLEAGFRAEEIAQAKAGRDQIASRLEALVNGPRPEDIEAARAQVRLAEAELDFAEKELARQKALVGKDASSRDQLDRATSEHKVAQASVEARREELNKLERGTRAEDIAQARAQLEEAEQRWQLMKNGYRAEEIEQARAASEGAEASRLAIQRQVEELTVRAPVDGVVEAVDLQPGDLVSSNAPVISILDSSNLWVRAYVPENRLGVNLEQKVRVSVDSFPGERFGARITFVSRQAEFTPSNVQTPEERSKQVFRIKATLEEGLDRLRPGMAADVHLERGG